MENCSLSIGVVLLIVKNDTLTVGKGLTIIGSVDLLTLAGITY
jgi:hypothetical protein